MLKHNYSKMVITLYKNCLKSNNLNITGVKSLTNFIDLVTLIKLNNMTILKCRVDNTFFKIKKKITPFKDFIRFCHNEGECSSYYKLDLISIHLNYFNCVYMKFGCGTLNIFEKTTLAIGFKHPNHLIKALNHWMELQEKFQKYYSESTDPDLDLDIDF